MFLLYIMSSIHNFSPKLHEKNNSLQNSQCRVTVDVQIGKNASFLLHLRPEGSFVIM